VHAEAGGEQQADQGACHGAHPFMARDGITLRHEGAHPLQGLVQDKNFIEKYITI
jgi:hypothetical protein